jgi:hypothetical protein
MGTAAKKQRVINSELRIRDVYPGSEFFPTQIPVLRIRIRDPKPFRPLDPGSGICFFRIPNPRSRNPDPKPIFLRA